MTNVGSVQVSVALTIENFPQVETALQNIAKPVSVTVSTVEAVQSLKAVQDVASKIFSTLAGGIGQGVQSFAGFDAQINVIAALSGKSKSEITGLKDEITRLGIVTSKSPQQVAEAGTELIKLGFSAEQTQKELKGLVALSEATGGSMAEAGKVVGATNSIFQKSATEIADVVAATANATAVDLNDFLQAISKAGGLAKGNNQSLEALATVFGLIRNAGFSAESAGTAVKTMITRLAVPTKQAEEALAKLGVTIRDQATGEMRNLVDLIPEFRTAFANFAPDEKSQLTKAIFGQVSGPAFLALLETTQDKIDSVYQTISNSAGTAGTTSQQLISGVSGALTLLQSSLQTTAISVGEALAPAVEGLANIAVGALNTFLALPKPLRDLTVVTGLVVTGIAGLVTALSMYEALQIRAKLATLGLGLEQLKLTAITTAQTIATISNNVAIASSTPIKILSANAETLLFTKTGATTTAMMAQSVGTAIATGALKLFGVQAQATATALGTTLATLGLAIGAIVAVKSAFDSGTAGLGEANAIKDTAKDLRKITEELTGVEKKASGFGDVWSKLTESFDQGIMNGIQTGLYAVASGLNALVTGADFASLAVDKFGNEFRVLGVNIIPTTKEQLAFQRATLATEEQVNAVSAQLTVGEDLLNKYGVAVLDASDKNRLGVTGIKEFTEKAKAQIDANQKMIDSLKAQKPANEEQQAMIQAQINNLEGQNRVLNQRTQALNSNTSATNTNNEALKEQAKSLDSVKSGLESGLTDLENTAEKGRTAIAQSLAGGSLTEDEAGQQTLALEKNTLEARLQQQEQYLNELRLLEKTTAEPEELAKIKGEIAKVESESQRTRTEIANKGYEERKNLIKEKLKDEESIVKKTNLEIEGAERAKVMSVKQAQLAGVISAEEAQKKIKDISLSTVDAQIQAEQTALQRKRELLAQGVISSDEYEQAEAEILDKIGQIRSQKLDQQIAIQEDAKKREKELRDKAIADELKAIEKANQMAERAVKTSVDNQILALKNKLLQGVITEEEYQKQVAQIQEGATNKNLENTQKQIAQLEDLKNRKLITEDEYYKRKIELEDNLANLNQNRIDQQLEAQKLAQEEAVKLIQERTDFEISQLDKVVFAEEQRINALKSESDLLNASLGLQKAQANLAEQRLQFAIENAQSEDEKFKLEQQLQSLKEANLAKTQQVELQILDIKQKQAIIEAQRQKTLADIAVLEAEAAIAQAQARGASDTELAKLQEILSKKQEIAQASSEAIASQEKLNKLERDTVLVNQQAQREALQQEGRKLDQEQLKGKTSSDSSADPATTTTTKRRTSPTPETTSVSEQLKNQGQTPERVAPPNEKVALADQKISQITSSARSSIDPQEAFTKNILDATIQELRSGNEAFLTALEDRGLGKIGELATKLESTSPIERSSAIAQGKVQGLSLEDSLAKLTEKIDSLNGNLQRPNVNVSTATPLEDTLKILNNNRR